MRCLLLAICAAVALASSATAQVPATSFRPQPPQVVEEPVHEVETGIGFLDIALPFTHARWRVDLADRIRRPTRAEFFYGADGRPLPERRLDYQEFDTYVEYALAPWFSVFAETPYRWVNPDFNDNTNGFGDINLGLKLLTWQDTSFYATFQFRLYVPTARRPDLGTDHVSLEPGFLAHYQVGEYVSLDGEVRYWIPTGGSEFAGDVLRYGAGVTFGQRTWDQPWLTPVLEVVGWSVLGGKAMRYDAPPSLFIENARGDTVVNVHGGVRMGWGSNFDIFAGYGRAVTGDTWYKDILRIEFRWSF